MTRRIAYLTGTRADFGLIRSTLEAAAADDRLAVDLIVTGMHLDPAYGSTADEIVESGLSVAAEVPVTLGDGGRAMAAAVGECVIGVASALEDLNPDALMVLGDRGEMLAGALAAVHLNIPVIHLHGGERSGTVDELIRHAITKLAHYHFTATEDARARIVAMGEKPETVFVTGAPGLDGIADIETIPRRELFLERGLDPSEPSALVIFHPVVQQQDHLAEHSRAVIEGTLGAGAQVVWFTPNADAGHGAIEHVIATYDGHPGVSVAVHMPRTEFVSWMAAADVMVGNSSAGIIEAASFGLPVVNVGDRQRLRERSGNVIDVAPDEALVRDSVIRALEAGRETWTNVYGTGRAGQAIVELLATVDLGPEVLEKSNTY